MEPPELPQVLCGDYRFGDAAPSLLPWPANIP